MDFFFFFSYFSSVKNWLTFDTELNVNSALILHGCFCCSPGRKSLCKMKDRTQSRAGAHGKKQDSLKEWDNKHLLTLG